VGVCLLKIILLWILHFPLTILWVKRVISGAV
jgi:hypothetical protein